MSFSNKVVLVTGGSSGIGASAAIDFAKEGADVVIVGRNQTRLNQVAEEISKVGKTSLVIQADVSKDDLKEIIEKTIAKYGKLDVLVNNAGIVRKTPVWDESLSQVYDDVMNTNLRSAVLLTNFAAPHLIQTKGNIVNISSVAGQSPLNNLGTGLSIYCTSKAGMDHFSRVAALELADKGVRVNTVSPGPVDTPIREQSGTEWVSQEAETALKIMTEPEEISDMILYLASNKARSITGSTFLVDCGVLLKM